MRTFKEFTDVKDQSGKEIATPEGENNAENDAMHHLDRAIKKAIQIDPIKVASLIEREFRDQEIEDAIMQFKNNKGSIRRPSDNGLGDLGDDSIKFGNEHPDSSSSDSEGGGE